MRVHAPLLALVAASSASAATLPPGCGPRYRGAETCLAGSVCTCDWYRGGLITAEPSGWRWNCRIERMCGSAPDGSDPTGGRDEVDPLR